MMGPVERWERGSDPSLTWAVSVAQPLASLLVAGETFLLVRDAPPPRALIGRDVLIHAGRTPLTFKSFSDAARARAERAWA